MMAVYVLERRQKARGHPRHLWTQYSFCARRKPLERVLEGLGGGTKEWRIRKTAAAIKSVGKAA